MRQLSKLTNIVPIIAKSDSLSHTQTLQLELSLLRDLRANDIRIFTFGKSPSDLERNVVGGIPWALSSLRDDAPEMDASLLMREEFGVQYVESDLPLCIRTITENASWLRFAATKKFLEWRRAQLESASFAETTSSANASLVMSVANPAISIVSLPSMTEGYAMARVGDHIEREERLARVRLVQWAGDMRRTIREKMAIERATFEQIESQERVKWLVARLNEAVATQSEQALVPAAQGPLVRRRSSAASHRRRKRAFGERDPLGLVWIKERWGPRVSKSVLWCIEAGLIMGSGWVVWKYFVIDSGLSGWFIEASGRNA